MVSELIEKIDQMADCLYQQKLSEGYKNLNTSLGELTNVLDEIKKHPNQVLLDEKKVLKAVEMAANAMEASDPVLVADIFHYEIKPELEKLMK